MFEFICQECGKGNVEARVLSEFETRVRGNPFTIKDAVIGICNKCGARFFDPNETRRWREVYDGSIQSRNVLLSADQIGQIQSSLGVSIADFARLIGATRQSLHIWLRAQRKAPQGRTADLLLKLIKRSVESGPVDVLAFLAEQAKELGSQIEVRPPEKRPCRSARPRMCYAPPETFDQLHNCTEPPRHVPKLVAHL